MTPNAECPMCLPGCGRVQSIGVLGTEEWFVCRACGWEFTLSDPLAEAQGRRYRETRA